MDKQKQRYLVELDFETFRAEVLKELPKDCTAQQLAKSIVFQGELLRGDPPGLGHLVMAYSLFVSCYVRAIADDGNVLDNFHKYVEIMKPQYLEIFSNVVAVVNPMGPSGGKPN